MKVYIVTEGWEDEYYSDCCRIVDKRVYLNEDDAQDRLEELAQKNRWSNFKIQDLEVKE